MSLGSALNINMVLFIFSMLKLLSSKLPSLTGHWSNLNVLISAFCLFYFLHGKGEIYTIYITV